MSGTFSQKTDIQHREKKKKNLTYTTHIVKNITNAQTNNT